MRKWLIMLCLTVPVMAQAEVVYLPTPQGLERFRRAVIDPSPLRLFSYVETEARQTFCGPTSLAAALNSLGIDDPTPATMFPYHLITQDSIFTPENLKVKSYSAVEQDGLTLDQLEQFAANIDAGQGRRISAKAIHAADVSDDILRQRMRAALNVPDTRLIANFHRKPLGQEGAGHFSPVAAYDAETDSFLILDVARYKYSPVWAPYTELHEAMMMVDSDSGRSRGVLIITRPAAAKQ